MISDDRTEYKRRNQVGQLGQHEHTFRAPCTIVFILAVALRTGVFAESEVGISRQECLDRARQLIKSLTAVHRANGDARLGWGDHWQSALWAKFVGVGAANGANPDATEIDVLFDFFELRGLNDAEKAHGLEKERLKGTWELIQRRESGKDIESAAPSRFGFVAGNAILTEGSERKQFAYFLDVTQSPKQLVLTMPGGQNEKRLLRMAYSIDSDMLVVCFDPRPGAPAPSVLETKPGDGRTLLKARSLLARRFLGHTGPVYALAISPDGKLAASGSGWPKGDRTIRLWDLAGGREIRSMPATPLPYEPQEVGPGEIPGEVTSVAFAPSGRHVVSGAVGGFVLLWDVATGKLARQYKGHTGSVYCVAFSPDGRRVASASFDQTVRLWDVDSGEELRRLEGHTNWVRSVAFSPDGRRILSGGTDRTMRLWDAERGELLQSFSGEHEGWVWSVAFSPDGRKALSASRTIRLWDLDKGQMIRRLDGHAYDVNSVAFTPDGRRAISGSWDWTVRLWDVETGQELRRFWDHTNWVWRIAVTPDGRFALSGGGGAQTSQGFTSGDDFAIRLWELP